MMAMCHCDNTIAEYDLNKYDSKNMLMMRLIRHIAKVQVHFNIRTRLIRISSKANILADALSRGDHKAYKRALEHWKAQRNQPGAPLAFGEREFRDGGGLLHRAEMAKASGTGP